MLKSKCILSKKEIDDGKRISIMSRHTKNDGKTPDERITKETYDIHNTLLAPPNKLIGKYYRNEISFDEYTQEYKTYLTTIQDALLQELIIPATKANITVLCIEDSPEQCHRKILLEHSKELADILQIKLDIDIQ